MEKTFLTTPHWQVDGREEFSINLSKTDFDESKPVRIERKEYSDILLISFDTEYEAIHKIVRDGNWRDVGEEEREEYNRNVERRKKGELLNRVLCYSYSISHIKKPDDPRSRNDVDIRENRLWHYDGIIYPKSDDLQDRISVQEFIQAALTKSKEIWGDKYKLPTNIYIISHFTKADLPAFAEFHQEDEKYKLGLAALRNTFSTLKDRYTPTIKFKNDEEIKFKVKFRDTYLLAPQSHRKLSDLGIMLGKEKIILHEDVEEEKHIKENMGSFFKYNKEKFEEYAIIDAVVAREYAERILVQQFTLTRAWNIPVTLTGIGVSKLEDVWRQDHRLPNYLDILGKEHIEEKTYSSSHRRFFKKSEDVFIDKVYWNVDLATAGYHGGRNEQFQFGVSSNEEWYDWDLESAYPTAMNLIGLPNWDQLDHVKEKSIVEGFDYLDLAVVAVNFKFKENVRFPCLPTRSENGIIFPREGYSVCNIQELKVAIDEDLLESWDLVECVHIPTDKTNRIFKRYLELCVDERLKAKRAGKGFEDKFWKELVNSTYGKTAQGLRERKVFNLKDNDTQPLPPSKFTNPFIAGFITSFVRATLAEVLNRLPEDSKVLNVITDGFLTNADEKTVLAAAKGNIGKIFTRSAKELGKEQAFGLKHRARQVIGFRTRGSATLIDSDVGVPGETDSEFILQRGSIKLLDTYTKKQDNIAIVDLFLHRRPDQEIATTTSMQTRDMWIDGNDNTDRMIIKVLSMEYDFKRRPINPREETFYWKGVKYTHLTFDTVPWKSLQEFQKLRVYLEEHNQYKRKNLKTLGDYQQFADYINSKEGSHKTTYIPTRGGSLSRLKQELCSAFYQYQGGIRQAHKMKAGEYAKVLRECGIECMVSDVYNGKKRIFTKNNVPATEKVLEALEKIEAIIPSIIKEDFLSELGEDVML